MNQSLKRTFTGISTGLAIAAAFTAAAHAEYRCNPPQSWVDREACKAAAKSSDELRRFVQLMNSMRINIRFLDYVEDDTASASGARR